MNSSHIIGFIFHVIINVIMKNPGRKSIVKIILFSCAVFFISCSSKTTETQPDTTNSYYMNANFVTQNPDFSLYEAWLELDEALDFQKDSETISNCKNKFLTALENEKHLRTYNIENSMYQLDTQITELENACKSENRQQLSHSITSFYISKGLIFQKSGSIVMQLVILMGILILTVMFLLLIYQFTYARRVEIEKILKATNEGQEEERRRLALELHDSVAQQMRYVSILAEKIDDEELAKEIKKNQAECIENIRNTCYTLSSINMDKSNFPLTLENAIFSFQKRTGITTSLVITPDVNFDSLPQSTFHNLFRIIMELLTNIEKHAQATEVTVLIRSPSASDKINNKLMIYITDDGQGLDPKIMEMMNSKKVISLKNMHFGLQNIKLRLSEINGSIKYFSEEGEGTEVEIRIGK